MKISFSAFLVWFVLFGSLSLGHASMGRLDTLAPPSLIPYLTGEGRLATFFSKKKKKSDKQSKKDQKSSSSSPTQSSRQQPFFTTVPNDGAGHCGFYAFAQGLKALYQQGFRMSQRAYELWAAVLQKELGRSFSTQEECVAWIIGMRDDDVANALMWPLRKLWYEASLEYARKELASATTDAQKKHYEEDLQRLTPHILGMRDQNAWLGYTELLDLANLLDIDVAVRQEQEWLFVPQPPSQRLKRPYVMTLSNPHNVHYEYLKVNGDQGALKALLSGGEKTFGKKNEGVDEDADLAQALADSMETAAPRGEGPNIGLEEDDDADLLIATMNSLEPSDTRVESAEGPVSEEDIAKRLEEEYEKHIQQTIADIKAADLENEHTLSPEEEEALQKVLQLSLMQFKQENMLARMRPKLISTEMMTLEKRLEEAQVQEVLQESLINSLTKEASEIEQNVNTLVENLEKSYDEDLYGFANNLVDNYKKLEERIDEMRAIQQQKTYGFKIVMGGQSVGILLKASDNDAAFAELKNIFENSVPGLEFKVAEESTTLPRFFMIEHSKSQLSFSGSADVLVAA